MSAVVYDRAAWVVAHERRARSGRAPRNALRRRLVLREAPDGLWHALVILWRFGKWDRPEVVCPPTDYAHAEAEALRVHRTTGLPFMVHRRGDNLLRPYDPANRGRVA